jgi:hypothetical protein
VKEEEADSPPGVAYSVPLLPTSMPTRRSADALYSSLFKGMLASYPARTRPPLWPLSSSSSKPPDPDPWR